MGHYTTVGIWIMSGRPDMAKEAIVGTLRISGGNLAMAARELGVSIRQMHRFIDRLALREKLEEIRAENSAP